MWLAIIVPFYPHPHFCSILFHFFQCLVERIGGHRSGSTPKPSASPLNGQEKTVRGERRIPARRIMMAGADLTHTVLKFQRAPQEDALQRQSFRSDTGYLYSIRRLVQEEKDVIGSGRASFEAKLTGQVQQAQTMYNVTM